MEVPVYNMQGQKVGAITIDADALGGRINYDLLKQAYVRGHTNQRQGSARNKNKSLVEGSTRKLYKQKHTGNARRGQVRTNVMKGGGVAHKLHRTREDFRPDMPVKMRRKANRNALLAKLVDNEVRVIDSLVMKEPKTRDFKAILEANKIDRSVLVALSTDNDNARVSARNLEAVTVCPAHEINCYAMLNHRYLLITKADLEAWLSGPSSKMGKDAKNLRRSGVKAEVKGGDR